MSDVYSKIEKEFKENVLRISLWASIFVHCIYLLFYLILFDQEYNPVVFTLGSSLLFHSFYFYWIKKRKYALVTYVFISATELLLVFLAFYVLGTITGVHYLLLIFSMLSFSINNEKKIKFSHMLFIVNIILFLGGELKFIPDNSMVTFPDSLLPYIKASCILITLMLIYYLSVYFKKTRIRKEIQLEKKQKEIHVQSEKLRDLNNILKKNLDYIEMQNKELEVANSTKNKLFSIISHDLINPLSTLSSFSDLLNEQIIKEDTEQHKRLVHGISDSVANLNQLTQNLLNWSRTQINTIQTSKVRFSIFNIIDTNIRLFQQSLDAKGIKVNCNVSKDIDVFADKDMIETVFRNLLNNAIKFSHSGGSIDVNSEVVNDEVIVSVRDYGVGMNEKIKENLFRIHNTKSTYGTNNEKGSGLGLIICYEFLKLNDCKLFVDSTVGKGTTFAIVFPTAKEN